MHQTSIYVYSQNSMKKIKVLNVERDEHHRSAVYDVYNQLFIHLMFNVRQVMFSFPPEFRLIIIVRS